MSMTFEAGARLDGAYRLINPLPSENETSIAWLAEGPDPSATYVVHDVPANQLEASAALTIGQSINQLQSPHLASFETLICPEASNRWALIERYAGQLTGPFTRDELIKHPNALRMLIGAIALLERQGHLIPNLRHSVYRTTTGQPLLLTAGWPSVWFGAGAEEIVSAQHFCRWLINDEPDQGGLIETSASQPLLQPVIEGQARNFSSWSAAITEFGASVEPTAQGAAFKPNQSIMIQSQQSNSEAQDRTRRQQFWMALALILAAGFVFVILPRLVDSTSQSSGERPIALADTQTKPVQSAPVTKKSPLEAARNTLALEQAEALAEEFLRRLLALEDRGLEFWDPAALSDLNQAAIEADDYFRRTEGESSLSAYRALIDQVAVLEARIPSVITALSLEAETLIQSGDFKQAQAQYRVLTLLDPTAAIFQLGEEKARRLPNVAMLLNQATERLEQQDPSGAVTLLEDARAEVPDWAPTLAMLTKARKAVAKKTFQQWMSQGFRALETGDFEAAEAQFKRALASPLNQGDAEEGLAQLASRQTNQKVDRLQKEFALAMREGAWAKALEFLDRLDALSPNSAALVSDRQRANERLSLEKEGVAFLADPLQLQSDDRLNAARAWIVSISRLAEPRGAMDQQRLQLARLVSLARAGHEVLLTSDGLTNIRLLRSGPEGQMGMLREARLMLIPGRYTLTGKRLGFIDTRLDFEVPLEGGVINIDIRCKDKL